MTKYRIVEEILYNKDGEELSTKYIVQKRFLGFLWWFDPFEDGFYSDGVCDTYEEALTLLNNHLFAKRTSKVIHKV